MLKIIIGFYRLQTMRPEVHALPRLIPTISFLINFHTLPISPFKHPELTIQQKSCRDAPALITQGTE